MYPLFRAPNQLRRTQTLHSPRFMLALLAALLITAVACGTDRDGNGDGVAASSFQIDGDSLTWAPPWDEGDARSVTVTSSVDINAAAQDFFDRIEESGGEAPRIPGNQTSTVGTIEFISTGSTGATGELIVSIEELMSQLENQTLEQPGFGEADFSQFTSLLSLTDQLDLGVEFGIDNNGAISGVTNREELAETIDGFVDSLLSLAAFAGDDFPIHENDEQDIRDVLAELPDLETFQLLTDTGLVVSTANLFLMRSGEYTIGQPVIVSGNAPSTFGLATTGTISYELTSISDGTATVEAIVSPGEVDLLALIERLSAEIATLVDGDVGGLSENIAGLEPDESSMFELLSDMIFDPYTVTLTLDANTGWVMAADWAVELSFPEGFEDLITEEDRDLDGLVLADFGATVNVSATFEEPTASGG